MPHSPCPRLVLPIALLALLALPGVAAAQCDEGPFGSHSHAWDAGLAGGVFNGQRWRIDASVRLTAIEFEARIPAGRNISWLVYEGASETGPWTQVFRQDTTSPGPNSYVWHTSGPIDHILNGGTHLVLGAHIAESWGHSGGVAADPAASWFGESISGANVDGNATPPQSPGFGFNYWTPTRIRVDPNPDLDGDGDNGCVDDCDDDDPLVGPSSPEVCDNGIDDDCDELTDEDDPDCAGDDDDSMDDDDSAQPADDDDSAEAPVDDHDDGGRRSGCGCSTSDTEPTGAWALALAAVGLLIRRRR